MALRLFCLVFVLLPFINSCALFKGNEIEFTDHVKLELGDEIMAKNPTLVLGSQDQIHFAYVNFDAKNNREIIKFQTKTKEGLSSPIEVTNGKRAWNPILKKHPNGDVWLSWCGTDSLPKPKDHNRTLWIQKISPPQTKKISVASSGNNCFQEMEFDKKGTLHLVWEKGDKQGSAIYYRNFNNGQFSYPKRLSQGWLSRRPSLAIKDDSVVVAWDSFVERAPTGNVDPDYDVFLKVKDINWSPTLTVDNNPGIQSAPSLKIHPDGSILIAYHTSHPMGILKHWNLRKLSDGRIWEVSLKNKERFEKVKSEVQGAEFPKLIVSKEGRVAIISRPSHSAYLHVLNGTKVETTDLSSSHWGARGIRISAEFLDDKLHFTRRGRFRNLYESFSLVGDVRPLEFKEALVSPSKKRAMMFPPKRVVKKNQNIFFGDVHLHSALSDGTGPTDEIYARSWTRGHDFGVLTDHDNIVGSRLFPSQYLEISWITNVFNHLDNFSTLQAYEWTTPVIPRGSGHRNIYFKDQAPNPVYGFKQGYFNTKTLFKALEKHDAFAVPHHIAWTGTDWENHDERIQRHIEIASVHGVYDDSEDRRMKTRGDMKGMFVNDGLAKGLRFGFVAGSDGHGLIFHHGQGRHQDPWVHGITGVLAGKNSRDQIWQAMYNRRTFATTGPPATVLVSANGAIQGEFTETNETPNIRFSVESPLPLSEVSIYKNGQRVHFQNVRKNRVTAFGNWQDLAATPGNYSYYVKAVMKGDAGLEMAWSSPVFLRVNKKSHQLTKKEISQ